MRFPVRLTLPDDSITSVRAYPEGWVVRELDQHGGVRASHLVPATGVLFINGQHRELPPLPTATSRREDDDDDEGELLHG